MNVLLLIITVITVITVIIIQIKIIINKITEIWISNNSRMKKNRELEVKNVALRNMNMFPDLECLCVFPDVSKTLDLILVVDVFEHNFFYIFKFKNILDIILY